MVLVDALLGKMPSRFGRRYVLRSDPTRPPVAFMLFVALLSVPVVSLYLGYVLGQTSIVPARPPEKQIVVPHTSYLNKTYRWSRYLTTDLEGGLGTRMFRYASLYGLAYYNHMQPLITEDSYLSSVFPGLEIETTDELMPGDGWPKFKELHSNRYDRRSSRLNYERNLRIEGQFQSWRYFDHIRDRIQRQFTFAPEVCRDADTFLHDARRTHEIPGENVVFVGVQIRRGDYLDPHNVNMGYTTASASYIQNAMDHFMNKYDNIIFIVSSDDKKWSRYHIRSGGLGVVHSSHGPASLDLAILSKCNHSIITVGAFGWWGAWLAGGDTLYYRKFPQKGSILDASFRREDFYYPDWIAMI